MYVGLVCVHSCYGVYVWGIHAMMCMYVVIHVMVCMCVSICAMVCVYGHGVYVWAFMPWYVRGGLRKTLWN